MDKVDQILANDAAGHTDAPVEKVYTEEAKAPVADALDPKVVEELKAVAADAPSADAGRRRKTVGRPTAATGGTTDDEPAAKHNGGGTETSAELDLEGEAAADYEPGMRADDGDEEPLPFEKPAEVVGHADEETGEIRKVARKGKGLTLGTLVSLPFRVAFMPVRMAGHVAGFALDQVRKAAASLGKDAELPAR